MKRPILLLAALCLSIPPLLRAGETGHFCTMDQAVDQMISAAGVDEDGMYRDLHGTATRQRVADMVRIIAEDQVKKKLVEGHGNEVKITWKDIYDVRGTASAWMCNEGCRMYCVGSFIDAIGAGLTGTSIGRGLTGFGLALAGPPGFVMMSGMEITQETFQCQPDAVAMALDAGATLTIMLPWCRAPGAKQLCVRAQQVAGRTVTSVMGRYMGREFAIGTARVLESEGGGEFARVVAEHLSHHGKETVTHAVTHQVHSKLMEGVENNSAIPDPGGPAPAGAEGTPIGDGLYYNDPAQNFQ